MHARPRVSLRRCLFGAVALPWQRRAEYFRALAVPLTALLALIAVWQLGGDVLPAGLRWPMWVLYALLLTMTAVRVHRLTLLGEQFAASPTWSRVEWRYLLHLALLWMVWTISFTLVAAALALALPLDAEALRVSLMLAALPAAWVVGRLLPVLPAAATGRRWDLATAWDASRGNGWRLAIVGLAVPWLIKQSVLLAYRDDATLVEWWLLAAVNTLAVAVQVTAVSLAFAQIDRPGTQHEIAEPGGGPRWLRGPAPVIVLLALGAAVLVRSIVGSSCVVEARSTSVSPDQRVELEYQYVACRNESPRAELWLKEGRTGVRLHGRPIPREPGSQAIRHPVGGLGWAWLSPTKLEVTRPAQAAASDGPPEFAGVDIVYRDGTVPAAGRP